MLLGALPIEAELHKRLLGLLFAVLTSENRCLQDVVQRQLACSFDNTHIADRIHSSRVEQFGFRSRGQKGCICICLYLPDTPNTSRRVLRGVRAKMALIFSPNNQNITCKDVMIT